MKTNPHLLYEQGKFFVVDLPEKPDAIMFETIYVAKKINKYKRELKQALSSKIEVHKDSEELAELYIIETYYSDHVLVDVNSIKDGEFYPVPGLKVEVKEYCSSDCCTENGGCGHCKEPKQFALLSLEETAPTHESLTLNKILSEITPEEQSKTEKEMMEQMSKEQLEKRFEKEKLTAAWINADIYPNGRLNTQEFTDWIIGQLIAKDAEIARISEKWGIVSGMHDAADLEILSLKAKIKELESKLKAEASCKTFMPDYMSSSLTKCMFCGKEKHEH